MIAYADFENAVGAATTPTAGSLRVEDPEGNETSFDFATLANPSVGRLEKTIRATLPGRWHFNWTMTVAGVQIVKEYTEQVRESRFPALP